MTRASGRGRPKFEAHFTPIDVARRLAAIALDGADPDAVVADPCCGGGAFLMAAGEALVAAGADRATVASAQLMGVDTDPGAVGVARAAIAQWGGIGDAPLIRRGDGLDASRFSPAPDVVVGNPPFLSPLVADSAPEAAAIRRAGGPYADAAGQFLLAALDLVRPGGRVLLIQPESVLAARDAAPIRAAVEAGAAVEGLWVAGERVFDVAARVCALLLRKGGAQPARVRRWVGREVREVRAAPTGASWAALRPTSAPAVRWATGGGVLGDRVTVSAGFRDEFYGLAAAAVEGSVSDERPRLVTSGLIDPGRVAWGERTARLAGQRYAAPVVDVAALDERMRSWVATRLVPKVLVATQTRVVEAAADPEGRLVPVTPVLAAVPHDPVDVWRVAAVLLSPAFSAWVVREHGGTALASDAVKVTVGLVRQVPLPIDGQAWQSAADALRAGDVVACGTAMAAAHQVPDRVLQWWLGRLRPNRVR